MSSEIVVFLRGHVHDLGWSVLGAVPTYVGIVVRNRRDPLTHIANLLSCPHRISWTNLAAYVRSISVCVTGRIVGICLGVDSMESVELIDIFLLWATFTVPMGTESLRSRLQKVCTTSRISPSTDGMSSGSGSMSKGYMFIRQLKDSRPHFCP